MAESGVKGGDGKYWYSYMLCNAFNGSPFASKILEKFAKLKSGEPQLKFHVEALRALGASLELISERVKNTGRAQGYRNCGNAIFSSNGDLVEVAEKYTKSIAYALPGSRELALAYANRSAVSFKAERYEDCLIDIERSLGNDYPDEMKAKLYARRVRCLVALKKPQTEIDEALKNTEEALLKMDQKTNGRDLVEKTLADENHMAPTTSTKTATKKWTPTIQDDNCDILGATGVTIQYSPKYGRHIVATSDIRPGEIIAVIDSYAIARNPADCYRECAHCTKATTVGIPCDHCVNVNYCSTSCRDKAWNDYHEIECPILGVMLDAELPGVAILGLRMTLKAVQEAGGVDELKEMLERIDSVSDPKVKGFTGNILDSTKYACIYTLASHAGKHPDQSYIMSLMSTFITYYLATLTEIFGQKYQAHLKIFDENILINFLGALMIKNFEISKINVSGVNNGEDSKMSPFIALCNHSCDPNVTMSPGNIKTITMAIKPIKAGEQLWASYDGLHYSSSSKAKRQQLLKDNYYFTCDCVACVKNWPMLEDLPTCSDLPERSPTIRTRLAELGKTLHEKWKLSLSNGDVLASKDELIRLIELLSQYACSCKEIIRCQQLLRDIHADILDFD